VRLSFFALDRSLHEIQKEQAVRQAGQRVRELGIGDIRERAGQPGRLAGSIPDRSSAAQHPPEHATAVKKPVLALVVFVAGSEVRRQRALDAIDVLVVHPTEPFLGTVANLLLVVAEHGFPAGGPVDLVRDQIPVPQPVIGSARGQRVPLFAVAQVLDGPFVRQMRLNARQSDRKVDRFGDVVVRAQAKRLDDAGPVASSGHHDDGKLGPGAMDAKPAQCLEAAHARHLDIQQNEIVQILIDTLERFETIGGDGHQESFLPQATGKDVSIVIVVVDHEQRAVPRRHGRAAFASSDPILSTSDSKRTGFVSKSSPPAASARSRSLVIAWALSTMMGICRVDASAFNWRVASHPSMIGNPRSIRMRSGFVDRATDTACWPSTATTIR
jgi:hypothetical protein